MSTINYTYNVIVDRFRQFSDGHFQLRRFTHGEISQADLEKEAEWPWMQVKPRAINYSPGTRAFSFEIFISDLPRDKEDKTGYQAESITDCSLIFQDLINEIHLGQMFGDNVLLTRPVNSEPFVEQYTHTLTGVTGIIELSMDYDWSACSIPASWNYNTPTNSNSSGFGSLQFIESLEQNGVFVSLDNDLEAPGNSYYYGTNGAGVKGWYASQAGTVTSVGLTAGTGISVSGGPITSSGSITVTNSAPDQVVALTAGTGITTSGTYPNFTITNSAPSSGGTVTSVTATLPISSTGGATPNLSMSAADGTTNGYLLSSDWLIFNGKFNTPSGTTLQYLRGDGSLATFPTITSGTVTSVAALTLGTTGTDLSSTVATSTTTPQSTTHLRSDTTRDTHQTSHILIQEVSSSTPHPKGDTFGLSNRTLFHTCTSLTGDIAHILRDWEENLRVSAWITHEFIVKTNHVHIMQTPYQPILDGEHQHAYYTHELRFAGW